MKYQYRYIEIGIQMEMNRFVETKQQQSSNNKRNHIVNTTKYNIGTTI